MDREKTLVLRTGSFLKNQTDPFVASDASIIKADFDAVLSSPQGDVAAGSISGGSQGDNPSDQSVESGPENGIASDDVDDSLQGSDPIDQSIESDRIQIFNFTDLPNMTSTDESLSGIKTHENYTDNLFNN